MADRVVTTTHQGYFSKLFGSIVGVFIGLLMVPGSLALIGWNEYRTIHRTKGLAEAEKVTVDVADALEVLPANDKHLVHVSGDAKTQQTLSDSDFKVEQVALRLSRDVQMYQWVERKESRTRDKLGGGRETVTTYDYDKKWHDGRVNSELFHEKSGHNNPSLAYDTKETIATDAKLGAYDLNESLVRAIHGWTDLALDFEKIKAALPEEKQKHVALDGQYLYYSDSTPNPSTPAVGDLRISFRVVNPQTISVLSGQTGNGFEPYHTSNGEPIERVDLGQVTTAKMFEELRTENSLMAYLLRGLGWFLACLGFGLISGPLSALSSIIPIFGRLTGYVTFFVSLILGSALSLTAIGIAWFAVRPVYAITLFALAAFGLFLLFRRRKPKIEPLPTAVLAE